MKQQRAGGPAGEARGAGARRTNRRTTPWTTPWTNRGTHRGNNRRAQRRATVALFAGALLTPLFAGAGAVADERTDVQQAGAARQASQKAHAPQTAQEEGADKGPEPIDFAIVVDKSESLSAEDLKREIEAAALIGQGEISERSHAVVVGFGSSEKEGQTAAQELCRLRLDAPGRQQLSDCVGRLGDSEEMKTGPGTDFPAALSQATERLADEAEPGTPKVVFLLTDGRLDVRDSPAYGKDDDPEARQRNGEKALADELKKARERQVQIWPLGFGDVDEKALGDMAAEGYRGACAELPGAKPRMRVVDDSGKLERALQKTFADARCARVADGTKGKPPTDLHVTIPSIATDGSITVTKRDPKVRATYYDPKDRPVPTSGRKFGSAFELSGQEGPVEALRVKNPLPGKWRVHLEAPEGHDGQEASVNAIWQGRLRSVVRLDPTSPEPGETARIEAVLQTRDDVVVDDDDGLGGVHATATLEGDGFDPVDVRLHDDGEDGDKKAGDARFSGAVEIPDEATGALSLTSEMAAPGVTGDERPYHTVVTQGAAPLTAGASVDGHSVHPGGKVAGTLNARNDSGSPHTLRLRLADRQGESVRISPSTVEVPAGESKAFPYRLDFGAGTPVGEAGGRIEVVDTTDGGRVVDDTPLAVTVTEPPTWWDRWWWAVAGGAALAAVAGIVSEALRRAGRTRRQLGDLELRLSDGRDESSLHVRGGQVCWFAVETGGDRPRLRKCGSGTAGAYRMTRDSNSGATLRVRPPSGSENLRGGTSLNLGNGLQLVVKAKRRGERERKTQSVTVAPRRNPLAPLTRLKQSFNSPSQNGSSPRSRRGAGREPDSRRPEQGGQSSAPRPSGRRDLSDHF